MKKLTEQIKAWQGEFGRTYTDRSIISVEEMDAFYEQRYGISRTALNALFLGEIDRSIRILEVGSNVGTQLLCLQQMGFTNLYGIEIQEYAYELLKQRTRGINVLQGSALDIPFKDNYFDLVFTSGVLIHVHPQDLEAALEEIHRCARRYIWGFEYYAKEPTEVNYRGHDGLLWKRDFARKYLDRFDNLNLMREQRFPYSDSPETVDAMFLLSKVPQ